MLPFILVLGGLLVVYMGLENQSFQGMLTGNKSPISGTVSNAAATTGVSATSGGGFVNPFSQVKGLVLGREDMGIDATMQPGSPILAPGDSTFLGLIPDWFDGEPYLAFQLPTGQNYYLAEQINPIPGLKPGAMIPAGQPIATYAGSGTGIEMGWAGGGSQPGTWEQTLAQAEGQASEANPAPGASTTYGGSFANWLKGNFGL